MSENYNLTIGDYLRDGIEKFGFAVGIMESFGIKANLDDFLQSTEGIILLKPHLSLVAPLSCSNYPFEINIEYKGHPKDGMKPRFSKHVKYDERIERISENQYDAFTKEGLRSKLIDLGEHRRKRLMLMHQRDSAVYTP